MTKFVGNIHSPAMAKAHREKSDYNLESINQKFKSA